MFGFTLKIFPLLSQFAVIFLISTLIRRTRQVFVELALLFTYHPSISSFLRGHCRSIYRGWFSVSARMTINGWRVPTALILYFLVVKSCHFFLLQLRLGLSPAFVFVFLVLIDFVFRHLLQLRWVFEPFGLILHFICIILLQLRFVWAQSRIFIFDFWTF